MPRSVSIHALDPNTPVIVGVGQSSERLTDDDYRGLCESDLASRAVEAALADTGVVAPAVAAEIDTVVAVRTFEQSTPMSSSPLGRPDNMPRAVAKRIGMDPEHAVLGVTGGQSPQSLLTEFAGEIVAGRRSAAMIFGAEVMSTVRHLMSTTTERDRPDFTEQVGGQLEDRGFAIAGLTTHQEAKHGLLSPVAQYAVLENARRHRVGLPRGRYTETMGELFAPMSEVAAANPHAAAPTVRSASELATVSEANRVVADPFTRFMVARDQVNQAAATLVMSVRVARQLGIDPSQWVFLHGHADTRERPLMQRPDLSRGPAAAAAVQHALAVAQIGLDDVAHLDIYSCFPIAVSNVIDPLGIDADDPRGLTLTGGLPFFGGPGNNYSMHAIAEAVDRCRGERDSFALVAANGGILSKTSVGIYSTRPTAWSPDDSSGVQEVLDAAPRVQTSDYADGPATIEGFTVMPGRDGSRTGIVIGRLDSGRRFIATVATDDESMFELLATDDPVGADIYVRSSAKGNRVFTDRASMLRHHPPVAPTFRSSYEHVEVRRDGHLLEVTINRPEARNALHPAANAELDEIFDAYFADADLWVAILTGAGDKAFSAGNDLAQTTGAGLEIPGNGFAGLTSRRSMPKPVIAAVNGFALGGGCEIAMACHIVVADERATFGLPEVRVGLAALAGGLVRLPAAVGGALARDMILTGRRLDAAEALAAGLISRIAPPGEVMDLARTVAAEVLAASPTSVRESLRAMDTAAAIPDEIEAIEATSAAMDSLLVSQDTIEGITAFVAKRPPRWTGR
ncbi:acetyl-CoA acetyltransferase [Gordonia aquimaris]|jgi:acetyl-CoA C-acetyltransferase|uniref:Probable enoyl-CoA hydratase EchA17 n=1 Tax=Gordonia aquimaris TaxID=2984863 RepID=A0A9X3I587_9ACTN|nr:acetyl-CoA acetyltransferase [Gordonia aquimaris]MCX2964785.1 acetyl-CoA acetyltransferase [Gordonia aquimaris]